MQPNRYLVLSNELYVETNYFGDVTVTRIPPKIRYLETIQTNIFYSPDKGVEDDVQPENNLRAVITDNLKDDNFTELLKNNNVKIFYFGSEFKKWDENYSGLHVHYDMLDKFLQERPDTRFVTIFTDKSKLELEFNRSYGEIYFSYRNVIRKTETSSFNYYVYKIRRNNPSNFVITPSIGNTSDKDELVAMSNEEDNTSFKDKLIAVSNEANSKLFETYYEMAKKHFIELAEKGVIDTHVIISFVSPYQTLQALEFFKEKFGKDFTVSMSDDKQIKVKINI